MYVDPQPIDLEQATRYAWYIESSNGTTYADGLVGDLATQTRGETVALTLIFRPTPGGGGAYSTGGYGEQYDAVDRDHWPRYEHLRALREHAGSYTVETTLNDRHLYQEDTPGDAPSLLVHVAPDAGAETPVTDGFWGLVAGIGEQNRLPETYLGVELDVYYLAADAAYDSRAALEADLRVGGP